MELVACKKIILDQEQQKTLENYRRLNTYAKKGQIVLAGSSLMEFFPVHELMQSLDRRYCVYNRGISGYVSSQLLENIGDLIVNLEPAKLFINIGTNDIGRGLADELWDNYESILRRVKSTLPGCQIYIMAYYPCNDEADFGMSEEEQRDRFATRNPKSLADANDKMLDMARRMGCKYIDVSAGLYDGKGLLNASLSLDGVHVNADGYAVIMKNLLPYFDE